MELPRTLLEAIRFFASLEVCHAFMVTVKWPDGLVTCPACGGERVGEIRTRRMFQCKAQSIRSISNVEILRSHATDHADWPNLDNIVLGGADRIWVRGDDRHAPKQGCERRPDRTVKDVTELS